MHKIWSEEQNAQAYEEYAQAYPLYRKTGQKLVVLAALTPDMTVVDLACGTGVVTECLIQKFPDMHQVIAIDGSDAMLEIAQKKSSLGTVQFHQARAEEIDNVLPPASVDVVLCNSAFWQMDTSKTLAALRSVLKSGGWFIFNSPARTDRDQEAQPTFGRLLGLQMLHIARIDYGYILPQRKKFSIESSEYMSFEQIKLLFEKMGFELMRYQIMEMERLAADIYAFMHIPVMSLRYLSGLDYVTRMEILDKAYQGFDPLDVSLIAWKYYVFARRDKL